MAPPGFDLADTCAGRRARCRLAPQQPGRGALYLCADASDRSNDARDFCRRMLAEAGVAASPGVDFDRERGQAFARFSYCGPKADVAALDHLRTLWPSRRLPIFTRRKVVGIMSEASGSSSVEASLTDLAALQGCWEQVYLEVDGVLNPPDEHTALDAFTIIMGNRFSVRRTTGEVLLEGVFELDASTSPKSITWIDSIGSDAGKRLPASYQLEGDSFKFIAADEGAPRPMVFRTGPGLTMRVFVRRYNK